MARFGSKKIKRFSATTRVVAGSKGNRLSVITPGLRKIKPKPIKNGFIPTPADPTVR